MDEKQTRYILSLYMKRYSIGDSPLTEEAWIDSHIEAIKAQNNGDWVPGNVFVYLERLRGELEKRYA